MILLNELSFCGQANSSQHARELIKTCARAIFSAKRQFGAKRIITHSSLFLRRLTPENSLLELLFELNQTKTARDEVVTFLKLTKSGQFADNQNNFAEGPDCACYCERKHRQGHPIALAAHGQGNLISMTLAGFHSEAHIPVNFCQKRHTIHYVKNITHENNLSALQRRYVASPKHSKGGWGTFMDLDETTAQQVLEQGISSGRRVFGFKEEKYYTFHNDNFQGFHGFPVDKADIPNGVLIKLEAMKSALSN